MKNIFKLIGIIAFVAVIGFSFSTGSVGAKRYGQSDKAVRVNSW